MVFGFCYTEATSLFVYSGYYDNSGSFEYFDLSSELSKALHRELSTFGRLLLATLGISAAFFGSPASGFSFSQEDVREVPFSRRTVRLENLHISEIAHLLALD